MEAPRTTAEEHTEHPAPPSAEAAEAREVPAVGRGAGAPPSGLGASLARLDGGKRAALALQLQRDHGNQYVQALARQHAPAEAPPQGDGGTPAGPGAVARPSLTDLRTIADTFINAEYASAARDGLNDAETILGNQFDYGAFLTALTGNLIWAAACFTTGGAAFLISVGGIAVGAAAPSASSNVDRPTFHRQAAGMIDGVVQHLLNQIDRVTRDIDTQATAQNWDDAETRLKLAQRLFRPEFIGTASGGIPTVNRGAIAHRVATDLLIKANEQRSVLFGTGTFVYDYSVSNFVTEHGIWPFDSQELNPVSSWAFRRGASSAYMPQGESNAVDELRREPLLQPSNIPWEKRVYVNSGGRDAMTITLDGGNQITDVSVYGAFEDLGRAPRRAAARTPDPPPDRVGGARQVLSAMWSDTGGQPAWIRGQDLQNERMPGRSRATR